MGKVIQGKYADASRRIIKNTSKKAKSVKKSVNLLAAKRKRHPSENNEGPATKVTKTDDLHTLDTSTEDLTHIPLQNEISTPVVFVSQTSDGLLLDIIETKSRDLFHHDELSNSYENYTKNDFGFQILDEICLEGLDGITIEAFWKRLSVGLGNLNITSDHLKEYIWKYVCNKEAIEFYKLQEPRGVLDVYDRSKYFDTALGVTVELAFKLPDIYPYKVINDPHVHGSCSTFFTRENISSENLGLDVKNLEKQYGTSLVMVANQKMRTKSLYYESSDPIAELVNTEYCMLERVGRSRRLGELTQGNMSISSSFKMDAKSMYHYKKRLMQCNLLAKQSFFIKSAVVEQNKAGKLLHLKRFFHKIKSKQMQVVEQIINVMKEKPDCRIDISELRKIFMGFSQPVGKIIKSQDFRKYVNVEMVNYREMYPNAPRSEYMRKARPVEKFIKCMELINPHVNVSATWAIDQADSDDENDEADEEATGGLIFNMECFKQVFFHILSTGRQGCTLQQIQRLMDVNSNTVRMCLKKLLARNVVTVKKLDKGKQRHLLYYANCKDSDFAKLNLNPQPAKLPNNVLAKFREKQRAAIEKSNRAPASKERQICWLKSTDFKWKYEAKVPELTCTFFIKTARKLITTDENVWFKAFFAGFERNYTIKLNTQFSGSEQTFEINKLLHDLATEIATKQIKINFDPDSTYVSKPEVNHMTKLILLKAAFGDVVINATTLNCFTRKRQLTTVPLLLDNNKDKSKVSNNLQYMGDDPVIAYNKKEDDISVEILVSTPPSEFRDEMIYPAIRELTERVLTRIRMILRMVHEKKVIEEMFRIVKMIEDEEFREGYKKKIDRKSLARILRRLVEEGYIKIFRLTVCNDHLTKTQTFICHPSVNYDHSLIQSTCQQLKWKYFVGTHKKSAKSKAPIIIQKNLEERIQSGESPFKQSDVMDSILELKELTKQKQTEDASRYNQSNGKAYGYKPKFIRMRVFHEFLYYLIYGYEKDRQSLTEQETKDLFESYGVKISQEDLEQIPAVYCKEISWKMFIPPLPHHEGWLTGWALMCDIILRLPISVLCKIHNVGFSVPELVDVLNHPIKRYYLVKDLPESIRSIVLFKRKYLFNIHDSICRLVWCGLIQFGPQKYKEKDQVFIYLNQKASLFDTTTSEPSYNKVTNKEYKRLTFFFNNQADVDNYWFNVYGICLSTKLNLKKGGQIVTIFDPHSRPQLEKSLESKTPEQALQDDTGEIPGDRRGAGGFDSSLWSHFSKNWFWAAQKGRRAKSLSDLGLRREKLEKVLPKNISFNAGQSTSQAPKVYLHKAAKEGKESKTKPKKYVSVPLKPSKSNKKITRRIPFRKRKGERQYSDHLDNIILKKIGVKNRARWSENEDRALFLCMVASIFLSPKFPKKQLIPYTVVRDVLHRICPESRLKRSKACQRRMKVFLFPKYHYIEDNASNLLQLKPVAHYYSTLLSHLTTGNDKHNKPIKYSEQQLSSAFVILMSYLVQHQKEAESVLQGYSINLDHLTEDRLEFTENNLISLDEVVPKYRDAEDEEEVKKDVLKSVIHSSLGCANKQGWTFQLFKIYQKYSDNLIFDALTDLKRTQTVAFNKFLKRKTKNHWHTPFQLSNLYVYSQATTFNTTTALEAYKTLLNLAENKKFLNFTHEAVDAKKYGQLLGLNELCTFWESIRFEFYLPRTMVLLNPHIKDHSELIDELALRWSAKLNKLFQDNTEGDLEQENEPENRSKSQDTETAGSSKDNASSSEIDTVETSKHTRGFNDSNQTNPLDLTVDVGDSETIDRLKTWVSDCMEAERERRSPSPEFMTADENSAEKVAPNDKEDEMPNYEETERVNLYNLKRTFTKDQIPTLEEIKEGMLKYTSSTEDRLIPHITDLSSLLNKDLPESKTDDEKLERLKNHFITQYAVLEDVQLDEVEELRNSFVIEYIQSTFRNKKVWEGITSKLVVKRPEFMSEVYTTLEKLGATQADIDLTNQIVDFVLEKKCLGASGPQITERFRQLEGNCRMELIVQTLVDAGIFIRAGICTLVFVHHLYKAPWLIETFTLGLEEQKSLEETASAKANVKEKIEKQLEQKVLINILVMPWIKVDGTLNEELFKDWLCNVLSHCLDNPKVTFLKLCEKFSYLKPVDIYYLVEVLRDLGCVEVFVYEEQNNQNLFSTWEYVKECEATFLHRFANMYVTANNLSMMCMGSFFYQSEIV